MRLNALRPVAGSRVAGKRVGRGMGSGVGKTCGRGHKGQKSRSGGKPNIGFEGGQMPLQRRLPKRGFRSMSRGRTVEIRLDELAKVDAEVVDLAALRQARLVNNRAERAKVILSGAIDKAVTLRGIGATKGARAAIENAGGKIEN